MSLQRCFLAIAAAIAMGWCEIASADLTGQYLFEEGSGATSLDTSGKGRNGTETNGPAYVAGLYPGSVFALRLNSAGPNAPNISAAQSVVLPDNTDFIRNAPGATLMTWLRLDGGSGDRTLISVTNGLGVGAPRAKLEIIDFAGTPRLSAVLGSKLDSGGGSGQVSSSSLTIGQTYFVAGVLDYVNGNAALYINGVQDSTSTILGWNGNSANTANKYAGIGFSAPLSMSTHEYWPGVIDGVRIFDQALSQDQIMNLYLHPDAVPEPASIVLAGAALLGLTATSRYRRRFGKRKRVARTCSIR